METTNSDGSLYSKREGGGGEGEERETEIGKVVRSRESFLFVISG